MKWKYFVNNNGNFINIYYYIYKTIKSGFYFNITNISLYCFGIKTYKNLKIINIFFILFYIK